MRRHSSIGAVLLAAGLTTAVPAAAQTPCPRLICPTPPNTATTITDVIDTVFRFAGEFRPPENPLLTDAEYNRRIRDSIDGIAIGIGTALASFPIASSAGFAYVSDASGGARQLKSVSFGSTFVERAVTNGRGVFNMGVSFQHSSFDNLQGIDLKTTGFPSHSQLGDYLSGGTPDPRFDGMEVGDAFFAKLDVTSDVFVVSGSYGLSSQLDFGWAVPVASLSVRGQLVREYNAALDYDVPTFPVELYPNRSGSIVLADHAVDATGIGDIVLRAKYGFGRSDRQIGMLMGEVRLPTGDEENLLGTGEASFKLLGGGTKDFGIGSVNVNGGYTFGGLTDEVNFAAGTDVALLARKQLTVSFDFISQTLRDTVTGIENVVSLDQPGTVGVPLSRDIIVSHRFWERGSTTLNRAAIGAKYQLKGNWLLTGSGLFRLNDNGYQAKFVGFVGLEHTWVTR
jgi:hypothetical protein